MLVIDAGHGGIDPGAIGNGIVEKDYTLEISLYQYNRFKELGVPVKLTRNSDKTLDPNVRTRIVRESGAKYCISNHINASGGEGAEIIKSLSNNTKLPQMIANELSEAGQNVRRIFTRKGASGEDYYYMHRQTGSVSTLIVEYGFLDDRSGNDVIQLKNDRILFAESVVKAYCDFIGHRYTKGSKEDVIKDALDYVLPDGVFRPSDKYNPDVRTIQTYLNYYLKNDIDVDGYYGKNTEDAIKEFQQFRKISADGVYGSDTKRELMEYYAEMNEKNKPSNPDVLYKVQAGAFGSYDNAKKMVEKLKKQGIDAVIVTEKK